MSAPTESEQGPDVRPVRAPEIKQKAAGPKGQLAIATYRNGNGQACFATGRVRGDEVGAVDSKGRFLPLPPEGGNCKSEGAPVGFQVEPVDGGGVLVSGVADGDIVKVELKADGVSAEGVPTKEDGAFSFYSPQVPRKNSRLRFVYADGRTVESARFDEPEFPSLEEMQRDAALAAENPTEAQAKHAQRHQTP
ncbi:hypothetical protein GKE82_24290 [Conexibacter sp. W3-3-2]|uniref:hypothetical protein n=1 Tax=Conexibacter sp. W3-3-2 TaxID=2675227 RepID=UPI0012B7C1FA|nr:hypothetical protein [Conexibacter sp. W3-3-2]MTD47329.1 hypothetical protein [Conexibacter sp. W3-3-2]